MSGDVLANLNCSVILRLSLKRVARCRLAADVAVWLGGSPRVAFPFVIFACVSTFTYKHWFIYGYMLNG